MVCADFAKNNRKVRTSQNADNVVRLHVDRLQPDTAVRHPKCTLPGNIHLQCGCNFGDVTNSGPVLSCRWPKNMCSKSPRPVAISPKPSSVHGIESKPLIPTCSPVANRKSNAPLSPCRDCWYQFFARRQRVGTQKKC